MQSFPSPLPFSPSSANTRALIGWTARSRVCATARTPETAAAGHAPHGATSFPTESRKTGRKTRWGGETSFSNAPATTKCNFNKCWRRNTLTSSPWRKYIHLYTQTHTHKHIHTTSMLARAFQRSSVRQFSASAKQLSGPHFPEGVYNNLPFKVKNRRIPYAVPHLIFWIAGCGIPFFAVYVQQKRAGNL